MDVRIAPAVVAVETVAGASCVGTVAVCAAVAAVLDVVCTPPAVAAVLDVVCTPPAVAAVLDVVCTPPPDVLCIGTVVVSVVFVALVAVVAAVAPAAEIAVAAVAIASAFDGMIFPLEEHLLSVDSPRRLTWSAEPAGDALRWSDNAF